MEYIIYALVVCLIIYLAFLLLPIILPIVAVIVIIVTIYILYMKHKIRKQMEAFDQGMEHNFEQEFHYGNSSSPKDDVIDVEYTESEEHDA